MPGDHSYATVDWARAGEPVAYDTACALMASRVDAIASGAAPELIWLLEHPPLYTAGSSAKSGDLLEPGRFPVHHAGRGGQYTYHGPGQRVAYVMLDVKHRFGDVRAYVAALEDWIIEALGELGVNGERRNGCVGVWVRDTRHNLQQRKIAAIGVRLRHWVSSHGFSLNVAPDLEHFTGIIPCGISDAPVTSLADMGLSVTMEAVDLALRSAFERRFQSTRTADLATSTAVQSQRAVASAQEETRQIIRSPG